MMLSTIIFNLDILNLFRIVHVHISVHQKISVNLKNCSRQRWNNWTFSRLVSDMKWPRGQTARKVAQSSRRRSVVLLSVG